MSEEGDAFDELVPSELSVTVRRDHRRVEAFDLEKLRGRRVEIYANGFTYRGVLQGADESEVYLKGLTRWWTVPLERIASLRAEDPEPDEDEAEPDEDEPEARPRDLEIAPGLSFDEDTE